MQYSERPYIDRFCLIFVSFDWIIFGSLHFPFHEVTLAQIPDWVPYRSALVVISGILEVATGFLILFVATRYWGAVSSLVLLCVLLPAVYHILANDSALRQLSSPSARSVVQALLLPHNILMAFCSYHLWRHPVPTPLGNGHGLARFRANLDFSSIEGATLLVAFLLLASNCAGFLIVAFADIHNRSIACLWGMMCIAGGALVGFLFAVPKVNPGVAPRVYLLPNNNIENISDWLTKIIVGVGLINLKEGSDLLKRSSLKLAGTISNNDSLGATFAMALILYFLLVGFIQGYLLTRMFLSWQFLLLARDPAENDGPHAKARAGK